MQMACFEEGVALLRDPDVAVAQPLADLLEAHTVVLQEPAAARAAKVVPFDVSLDTRPLAGLLQGLIHRRACLAVAVAVRRLEQIDAWRLHELIGERSSPRQQRYAPSLAALGDLGSDGQLAGGQIHV